MISSATVLAFGGDCLQKNVEALEDLDEFRFFFEL